MMDGTRQIQSDVADNEPVDRGGPGRHLIQCKPLLVLLFAIFAVSPREIRAQDIPAAAAAIDQAAQAAIAAGESPGLQVAVYKDGAPLLVKSYGLANLELNVLVNNESVFRIGSVTKQFTAVALLQLQEEGKLSLNDRLAKYYPDYSRAADITLEQMLHHTSGLHDYTEDETFGKRYETRAMTTDQWVDHFAKMPKTQDFEPGTGWHYSNTGYFLLGGVIEKLEGKALAAALKDRFFAPLGMTHTAVDDEKDIVPGRVAGYDVDAQDKFRNAQFISMTAAGAAGAMRSTAGDLVRWNKALFGGKLLKPASFQAMIAPGKLNDGRLSSSAISGEDLEGGEYGHGLVITKLDGHVWIGHGGGIHGFSSFLAEFPNDGITVAVIANSIGGSKGAGNVTKRIRRIAVGAEDQK